MIHKHRSMRNLSVKSRNLIGDCDHCIENRDEFEEAVKALREHFAELMDQKTVRRGKTKAPNLGQELFTVQTILSEYKDILRADAFLFESAILPGADPPDDERTRLIIDNIRELNSREDLTPEENKRLVRSKEALMRILHQKAIEIIDTPEMIEMCDVVRSNQTKKKREQKKRKKENGNERGLSSHGPELPILEPITAADISPKLWIVRLMRQRSSAGERAHRL